MQAPPPPTSSPQRKKLLDQVSDAIRVEHYSSRTEKTYKDWIRRCITIQELLGYKAMRTTTIYAHVLKRSGMTVRSPLEKCKMLFCN